MRMNYKKGSTVEKKKVKGKYPSKGMNSLSKKNPELAKKIMGYKDGGATRKMFGKGGGADTHVTKDGRTVKKGLYYYMNKKKKSGKSKPGKGTVSDKALKRAKKTAKKNKRS